MTSSGPAPLPKVEAAQIDERLVRRLLARQFPQWAHLPLQRVVGGGKEHRMFRLGDELSVRLPSAAGYTPQVTKEQNWLPRLAPQLPLPVPDVRGVGCLGVLRRPVVGVRLDRRPETEPRRD